MRSAPPFRLRLLYQPLRIFFKLLYHQMSWTYDWVAAAVSLGMWNAWIKEVIPFLSGPRILELGHGPGHLQADLLRSGERFQVFGIDLSPQMGRQAQKRLRKLGFQPSLINADGRMLPLSSDSIDSVVATFPTEYILREETLSEIRRALKPGGKVVILGWAWITGRSPLERSAAWLFHITGQAPEWSDRVLEPFRNAGFQPGYELVDLPTSRLLIIKAIKVVTIMESH